jgi:hypothetical protein
MSEVADLPDTPVADLAPFLDGDAKEDIIANQYGFLITEVRPHVAATNPQFKDQTFFEIAFLSSAAVAYLEKIGKAKDGKVLAKDGQYYDADAPGWVENTPRWILPLQHNKARENQAASIAEVLALGSSMVGPCWLTEKPHDTPGFNATRLIVGAPKPVAAKAKKSPTVNTPATTSDEDIPF